MSKDVPVSNMKKSMHKESLGEFYQRIRNGGTRKPLRTRHELAEEFNVSVQSLASLMNHDPTSPRPVFRNNAGKITGGQRQAAKTWFDPDEVRAWWKKKQEANK